MTYDPSHRAQYDNRVDRYLDGQMSSSERASLEALAATDPVLRRELDSAAHIDQRLRAQFTPAGTQRMPLHAGLGSRRFSSPTWRAAAAILLLVVVGAYFLVSALSNSALAVAVTPEYRQVVADGFKPTEVCTTSEQFVEWTTKTLGQPLSPAALLPGTQLVGWKYSRLLSNYTSLLLARVDGQPVLVIMDQHVAEGRHPVLTDADGLHVFSKQIGSVLMIEITPLTKSAVIDAIQIVPTRP